MKSSRGSKSNRWCDSDSDSGGWQDSEEEEEEEEDSWCVVGHGPRARFEDSAVPARLIRRLGRTGGVKALVQNMIREARGDTGTVRKRRARDNAPRYAFSSSNEEEDSGDSEEQEEEEEIAEGSYEVARIFEKGVDEDGETLFRVRWKGFGRANDTWEPRAELLINAQDKVLEFERRAAQRQASNPPKKQQRTGMGAQAGTEHRDKHDAR